MKDFSLSGNAANPQKMSAKNQTLEFLYLFFRKISSVPHDGFMKQGL